MMTDRRRSGLSGAVNQSSPPMTKGKLSGASELLELAEKALAFYADPLRYQGANQRNDANDPYSDGAPYIKDMNRDNGGIARRALAALRARSISTDGGAS